MFSYQPFPPEDALPPEQVRFEELRCEPWPDGRRVRVHLQITPFQQRPNLEAHILNPEQEEVASISIIENMDIKLVFTMHIREPEIHGPYKLQASLSYPEIGIVDQGEVSFETSEMPPEEQS